MAHENIRMIVGLGNPGPEYAATRHNVGFMVMDALAASLKRELVPERAPEATLAKTPDGKLWLLKPLSYMNASGNVVARCADKFGIAVNEILVVYDDLDLPVGTIRVRNGGSGSGGHKGVESMIERLGSADFARLRLGIGKAENGNQAEYVLTEFDDDEKEALSKVLGEAVKAIMVILHRGTGEAMNKFNRRRCLIEKVRNDSDPR